MVRLNLLFVAVLVLVASCSNAQTRKRQCLSQQKLICNLQPTDGNNVSGTVFFAPVFTKRKCQVNITARVSGLTPGRHGFHIHTYGDLSKNDGTSLGGHFSRPNLAPVAHGFNDSPIRHWGDFGNIRARRSGKASFKLIDSLITLKGIVGRGMIIHELADMGPDFQPTGAAGRRQAYCVIGFTNPDSM